MFHKDRSEMENVVLQYFTDIFSSTQPDDALMGDVLNAMETRVSVVENHRLTLPFTAKEVTDALSSMSLSSLRARMAPTLSPVCWNSLTLNLFRIL